ncbi:MAG: rhomboid family intramembrane serine protease [Planctomycetota bacterium]|nr:rhomboid family intramembrane serine protease [Planctomycetota bacterium]
MILPIGDSPNPRTTPWITWSLIAVNVLVYLLLLPLAFERPAPDDLREYLDAVAGSPMEREVIARQTTRYDLTLFEHGFRPAAPRPLALITAMFLHGGLAHLAGNMLFLWIFGNNVEHRLGRLAYLAAYLGTGAAASLGDMAIRWDSPVPSVGASGAISGVLGFYFVWFPQNKVHLWVFLFPFFMDVIELPARVVLAVYVLVHNLLPLLIAGGDAGVAYGAHLGGFFAGALTAVFVRAARPELEEPDERPEAPGDLAPVFRQVLDEGRLGQALWLLLRQPGGRALPPDDVLRLARALEEAGRPQDALAAYLRVLADPVPGRSRVDARLGAGRLLLRGGQPTLAYQHLRTALDEGPDPAQEAAIHDLLRALGQHMRSLPRGRWRP